MGELTNEILLKKMAEKVKSLRISKGMTQLELQYETGINVGRLENGKRNIPVTTLLKLCKFFNITFAEFFSSIEL